MDKKERDFAQSARDGLGVGSIIINRRFIEILGGDIELAFILGFLIDEDKDFKKGSDGYDGWFYSEVNLGREYGMPEDYVMLMMKKAVDQGLVETSMEGQPAKLWVKINNDKLEQLNETVVLMGGS